MNKPSMTAVEWESYHQRQMLLYVDEQNGTALAEEFAFGCDSIQHVAEALIAARALSGPVYTKAEIRERLLVADAEERTATHCWSRGFTDRVIDRAFPDSTEASE